jgi:hypothetical protein
MKTKPKVIPLQGSIPTSPDDLHRLHQEWWIKIKAMTKAEQLKVLIRIGALTPDGKVTRYPMDHVPLGPRE